MVGKYNVYNYLTAMLLSYYLGIDIEDLLTCNDKLQAPEGRMELIKYQGNSIFIDFAHTPDGMKNVLEATKDFNVDKVITIFGCGGNRDKTKRPIMGEIACKNSTKVIITNDNPRHEKPLDIINDITKDLNYSNYEVIPDRKEAIKRGMSLLNGNDVLMLLGKGHEQYEIIGDEKIHYNDKEEVYKYMNKDKKIAFFDVDGTLLDVPNGMVHPTSKTVEALTQFQKEGNYIVVASARGVIPDSLNVIDFDGLVGCDGHYIEFHHDIYIDNKFSVEEMKMMDKVAKENNGSYIFSGHYGEWLMDPRDPLIRKHQTIYLGTPEPARGYDFKWEYSDVKSNVATIIFNNANDMYQALKQLPKDWAINAYDEDHIRMDIHKQGFSKGTGCMYLANQLGISQENTYAFGDGFNDREMLKLVSHGQAMGNAVKELEGYYDEKIDSVDNDGIYKYFKKNLL
jgi:Cof subfamily protein (haloacid dehalogenase superfamily)